MIPPTELFFFKCCPARHSLSSFVLEIDAVCKITMVLYFNLAGWLVVRRNYLLSEACTTFRSEQWRFSIFLVCLGAGTKEKESKCKSKEVVSDQESTLHRYVP